MSRVMPFIGLALGSLSLSGCLSQVAPHEDSASLKIGWEEEFESACNTAAATRRPILVVMAAGALRDKC